MTVDELALVPFSFPTDADAIASAAVMAMRELASPSASSPEVLAGAG